MTRTERLARDLPVATMIALGVAGILSPEPWNLRAAMAQMVVVTLLFAPMASKAMVELILGPAEIRDVKSAIAKVMVIQHELDDALAGYLGWRVRLLGLLRGYRAECVQKGAHRLVDQVDPMIRDLAAEVGPLPEQADAN